MTRVRDLGQGRVFLPKEFIPPEKGRLMGSSREIWNHEVGQAEHIAKALLDPDGRIPMWKIIVFPLGLVDFIFHYRQVRNTRQNLMLTKELAFQAATAVDSGEDRALTLGLVDAKTREILKSESEGLYSEAIRQKQLKEIEVLFDHYLKLLGSSAAGFASRIRDVYESREGYEDYLKRLEKREDEVIQAAVTTLKKGSKKERIAWFKKVQDHTREARMKEVEWIFPQGRS